jgi:endonuclease YncB( thermonuclease family)
LVSIGRYSLIAALCLMAAPVFAETISGIVVGIADGDTLTVLDSERRQHKIRLAGIDAPEKAQPFGQKSKTSLSAMVFNREVEVIGDKKDRYGRTVGKVMAADPNCNTPACPKIHDVNLMQVMSGMAWWYRQYAKEQSPQDRENYEAAEFNAKVRRLGLWADKNPVPPWEWRRR